MSGFTSAANRNSAYFGSSSCLLAQPIPSRPADAEAAPWLSRADQTCFVVGSLSRAFGTAAGLLSGALALEAHGCSLFLRDVDRPDGHDAQPAPLGFREAEALASMD